MGMAEQLVRGPREIARDFNTDLLAALDLCDGACLLACVAALLHLLLA